MNVTPETIEEARIAQVQQWMEKGILTARQLVLLYMERLSRIDQMLNSVLELNPDALHIAESLDRERALKGPRGSLHGIPILLKDNIGTKDKLHTSAGSLALAESFARRDATIVEKIRGAGAVILGKANMTEWANFMTEHMPNGYSSRGGQVLNPYGPGIIDVGGSSSGSGAAVAANLTMLAIGTETSGSILSPSSQNSIVGIKPTVGLVSRFGIIPISHSQDTAGPMARSVEDAAILLNALSGPDRNDPATGRGLDRSHSDYTQFLDADGLRGTRLGIVRPLYFDELDPEQLGLMDRAVAILREHAEKVVDPVSLNNTDHDRDYTVLVYEFKAGLNAYLHHGQKGAAVRSLKELISYNQAHSNETLRYGQTLLTAAEKTSGTLTEPQYIQARLRDLEQSTTLDKALDTWHLDALVFPANAGASIAAKAGYPSITVPVGYTSDHRPLGITFTGPAFSEPTLLRIAYAFEQKTRFRKPPHVMA